MKRWTADGRLKFLEMARFRKSRRQVGGWVHDQLTGNQDPGLRLLASSRNSFQIDGPMSANEPRGFHKYEFLVEFLQTIDLVLIASHPALKSGIRILLSNTFNGRLLTPLRANNHLLYLLLRSSSC